MVGLVLGRPDVRRDVEIGLSLGLTPGQFDEVPEDDQDLLRAEWSVRNDMCSVHHGPLSECSHDTWYPQRTICVPAMELAAAERMYGDLHEERPFHDGTFTHWSKKASVRTPYHFLDGVRIWVSETDLSPDDDFLRQHTNTIPEGGEPDDSAS